MLSINSSDIIHRLYEPVLMEHSGTVAFAFSGTRWTSINCIFRGFFGLVSRGPKKIPFQPSRKRVRKRSQSHHLNRIFISADNWLTNRIALQEWQTFLGLNLATSSTTYFHNYYSVWYPLKIFGILTFVCTLFSIHSSKNSFCNVPDSLMLSPTTRTQYQPNQEIVQSSCFVK